MSRHQLAYELHTNLEVRKLFQTELDMWTLKTKIARTFTPLSKGARLLRHLQARGYMVREIMTVEELESALKRITQESGELTNTLHTLSNILLDIRDKETEQGKGHESNQALIDIVAFLEQQRKCRDEEYP